MDDQQFEMRETDFFIQIYDTIENNSCDLEPNHTHFIFFDDEPDDIENVLIKRQKIEHALSSTLATSTSGYRQENGTQPQQSIENHCNPLIHLSSLFQPFKVRFP